MARQTLSLDDYGKKCGNDRKKNFSRNDNKNFNNRNDKRGNNLYHGTPQNVKHPSNTEKATAPYNFVSLPEKVLPSEIETVDAFKNHIENHGTISGEIELEIEALTPLFFGGNGEKSFAPVGTPIISGSSLRGMFKNIFKIVTCGTFRGRTDSQKKGEDFNDEHIYYRCIMGINSLPWTKDLNKAYNDRMVGTIRGKDGKIKPAKNARPGFLIQTKDNKYFIAPSIYEHDRKTDKIFIKEYEQKYNVRIAIRNSNCVEWRGREAYIITGSNSRLYDENTYQNLSDNEKKRAGKQFIRFTSIDYVDWSKRIELPEDVRESYEHDRNRRGVNLFTDKGILKRSQLEKLCKNLPADVKTLIPCHFLYENNQVTAFGHGQCFRIPYKNAIGDIVPENLKSTAVIDFADALFGLKENWASRVAFEDAAPISEIETLDTAAAHPLMQPNPTSYQLYLLQQSGAILTHWDKTNATLRGYKLYWHNGKWDWKANEDELKEDKKRVEKKQEPLAKNLTPLKKGSKFKSKIRFQNLSAVELGALLMIFDLNGAKNPAYKIGMGKSLGFGSIKITPKLFVENDDAYTADIFDSDGFISPYKASDTLNYINSFKNYLNAKIGLTAWQKVMKELNTILDWENKPVPEKIFPMSNTPNERGQMELDERLRQRVPLPNIFDVK